MLKNVFPLLVLIISFGMVNSCADDDLDTRTTISTQTSGSYKGALEVLINGAKKPTCTQYVYVTKQSESTVKLEIKDLEINTGEKILKIGDVIIPDIPLQKSNADIDIKLTSTTIDHADLGKIDIIIWGTANAKRTTLRMKIRTEKVDQPIEVTFNGTKTNNQVDPIDYAAGVPAWYSRESLVITGDKVDDKWPTEGVEIVRHGFNQIQIKSFFISFPAPPELGEEGTTTQQVDVQKVFLTKSADALLIDTVDMDMPVRDNQTAHLVLSGIIKDGSLTLNMRITAPGRTASYVYTGAGKKTGAAITKMTINSDIVIVQPEIEANNTSTKSIVFYTTSTATPVQLMLTPVFEIAPGATIHHNNTPYVAGTPVDFSKEQSFKVVAESGQRNYTYKVTAEKLVDFTFATNFDEWERKNTTDVAANKYMEYDEPINGWGTSNDGVKWIKMVFFSLYAQDAPYAVTYTSDSKSGKAARLETLNTTGQAGWGGFIPAVPKVTSGTVFSGLFIVNMSNTLKSTKFGYPCTKQPKSFQGSYKFTPGPIYYKCADPVKANEVVVDDTKSDAPGINAVLYEVDSYKFDVLDGTNLMSSDKIIAVASLKDESAKTNYTDFNIPFDFGGKKMDPTKKYKLAIVCSSSKLGDQFTGAPGSVLYVDDLKVNF